MQKKTPHDPDRNFITIRKFDNYLISEFINKLSNESWDGVFDGEDVNEMFNSFLNDYLRIFNSCFPLQIVSIKNNYNKNKWITKGIKISCNNKRKLYLSYRLNPKKKSLNHYKLYCKILTNVIKEAKKIYYNKKVLKANNKCRVTWDIINEISGHHHTNTDPQELKIDHRHIINSEEIAERFNKYFASYENDHNKLKQQNNPNNATKGKHYFNHDNKSYPTPFTIKLFSTKEISSIIKSIKSKNTYGYDDISTKMLKISCNYIISPLTFICNYFVWFVSRPFEIFNNQTSIQKG